MSKLWYPYAQHKTMQQPLCVQKADGVYLHLDTGETLIDGISSWWCAIHGYNHPKLNQAISDQLQNMAHVMLGGLTHKPAQDLADTLVNVTPNGLNHVFFSDSGSVGMEVAMKLALQYWRNKDIKTKTRFVALRGAYHGDTCGVISIGDPQDGMHADFASIFPKQFFIEKFSELDTLLKQHHQDIAAFVVEPLMQGAGGFKFYPPEYLNQAAKLCKAYNVLFIFDEVATGFGRTGTLFAANQCNFTPDIMVLGKALTGGYIGHAATLTTTDIFNAFYDDEEPKAFMHGPTFMGNPLACAVANTSIQLFQQENYLAKIKTIETHLKKELLTFKTPAIKECRVQGGVGVIEVHEPKNLQNLQSYAQKNGIWLRPFGNIVYTTPPYIISESQLQKIIDVMKHYFFMLQN
ncbi:MAG: adenosylmethionine--8-amino-7-oxononanoate transaminase [Candidatus Margulisbacteria bacterium]|nr:adenosylmethionine--8-amino-7-oxononanoate transaminase [Candidatus Margulisiibacteriota bacterium]